MRESVSSELKPQKIEHEKNKREGEIWMRVREIVESRDGKEEGCVA